MLEQDTKTVEGSPNEIQRISSAGICKDPLRFMPTKRMFLQENFREDEIHKKEAVSCLKSNSKILKKKRHKDKFKLFKLDKHLWDPTIQISHLGKSGKSFKKKDRLAAAGQMTGIHIPGREKMNCVENNNQNWPYHPKPLEYTFDILCLTGNDSHPPISKELEDTNKSLGNDLLTMSTSFQGVMSVPKAEVTNKLFLGDLIDLGTPKSFESKAGHLNGQLFEHSMDKVEELDKASSVDPHLPSLNSLLINSVGLCSLDVEASIQPHITSELKSLSSDESEDQSSSTALIMSHHNDSESSKDLYNPGHGERVSSPLLFYGFPGVNSPMGTTKNQEILKSHNTRQMLVDLLNKDPFPKVVREKANIRVRRRAFSMDDSLVACLPGKPLDAIIDPDSSLELDKAEVILNGQAPCPQTSELDTSSETSSKLIEDIEHSTLEGESDGGHLSNCEKRCSNSTEMVPNDLSECSKNKTSVFNLRIANEDDDYDDEGSKSHYNMSLEAENHSISERDSGVFPFELADVNISKEDSNSNIPEISLESSSIAAECENVSGKVEGSEKAENLELILALASDNTLQMEDQISPMTSNMACIKKLCESLEENQPSKPSTANVEELENGRNSILQHQVSLNPGKCTDSVIINMHSSLNFDQETSVSIVNTSEMGLLVNSEVDGSDHRNILAQKTLEKTPIAFPSDKTEILKDGPPDGPVFCHTNPRTFEANDNVMNEDTCLTSSVDASFTTLLAVGQETSVALGTGLSSAEHSNNDIKESNLDRGLKQYSDYSLINISAGKVDRNTGSEMCKENIAEVITTPIKEIAAPTRDVPLVTTPVFEHSNDDSSFGEQSCMTPLEHWVLPPGKKFRRSLSIIRNLDEYPSAHVRRGRHYEKSVEEIIRLQGNNVEARTPVQSLCKRLSKRRSSWIRQLTPPPVRRSTFIWSPTISDRGTLYETPHARKSIYSTPMQKNLIRRMSVRTSPMLGPIRRSMRSSFKQDCTPTSPVQYTIRDLILTICKQTEPCSFSDLLSEESYKGGCKIGEGVFGEVFSINRDGEKTVLKIIPIEGQQLVNGEKQKTYQEVLSELVIAKVLDELRYEGSDESNLTSGYAEVLATSLVQDSYPENLLQFWAEFDRIKGSDNENPQIFDKEQLFIVMEQGNGGKDLESYNFSSAKQSLSIFKQIAFTLAVAEMSVEFEHRDLHWGNVLVSKTSEKQIFYTLNGTQYSVASNGVKCTIIDYTLSRIKYINQVPIYNDIGKDPEMFIATGDCQFDIYRFMKKDVDDDWSRFAPKTNARWLHYLLDKMLTKVKYQRKTAKVHKDSLKVLEEIGTWTEGCGSALSIALRLVELKY